MKFSLLLILTLSLLFINSCSIQFKGSGDNNLYYCPCLTDDSETNFPFINNSSKDVTIDIGLINAVRFSCPELCKRNSTMRVNTDGFQFEPIVNGYRCCYSVNIIDVEGRDIYVRLKLSNNPSSDSKKIVNVTISDN